MALKMVHNRKKLIDLFVGNLSNAILHRILEKAVEDEIIRKYYDKEFLNSLEIAKIHENQRFFGTPKIKRIFSEYREKINPMHSTLKEASQIKAIIIKKVTNELKIRISKGYKNIDLSLAESTAGDILAELKVT